MARRKRPDPLLAAARTYISRYLPELKAAPLQLRMLDGPPGSPCCAVMVETCPAGACPRGVPVLAAARGECTVRDCPLRCSVRLLLNRSGMVVQATRSGIHWS
jgi:hypothetical protein